MFHFFGEILVAVTGEIRNGLFVLGLIITVINIQQFEHSGFPFVPVLFGELFAHEEYQVTYTYLLSRFGFQLVVTGLQVHVGIEIRCGNFLELFSHTDLMNE